MNYQQPYTKFLNAPLMTQEWRLGLVLPITSQPKILMLFISILALNIILIQFMFRGFDDNTLLSWQWVMTQHSLLMVLLISLLGLLVVYKSCLTNLSNNTEASLLVLGSFLLGMLVWTSPELIVDSARYFAHAKTISTNGLYYFLTEWGRSINAWTDLPLTSIIYGLCFSLLGESRFGIQLVNTVFFSGSIYLCFLIGKEIWDAKTGLLAAWMLLAIPFLHIQMAQLLIDIPAMFFTELAIFLSIVAIRKGQLVWIASASLAIVAAMLTKFSTWIVLSSIILLPLIASKDLIAVRSSRLIRIGAMSALLLVTLFHFYKPVILQQFALLAEYQVPALNRWSESVASTFFYRIHPFVTIAAIGSLVFVFKQQNRAYLIPAVALSLMLLVGINRSRYLIVAFPFLALLAAVGLNLVKDFQVRNFIARTAAVISIAITLTASLPTTQEYSAINLKNAGNYLNHSTENNAAIIVLPHPGTVVNPATSISILDYYTNKNIQTVVGNNHIEIPETFDWKRSPLRFSWAVNQFPYQAVDSAQLSNDTIVAVISSDPAHSIPTSLQWLLANYVKHKAFSIVDNVFRFQTIVTLYRHKTVHKGDSGIMESDIVSGELLT